MDYLWATPKDVDPEQTAKNEDVEENVEEDVKEDVQEKVCKREVKRKEEVMMGAGRRNYLE